MAIDCLILEISVHIYGKEMGNLFKGGAKMNYGTDLQTIFFSNWLKLTRLKISELCY